MAYNSGVQLSGLAGIIGAGVGGYLGYNQAAEIGMDPLQGALIMGGIGMVVASLGAFVLKSIGQFLIYIVLFGILAYFFRDQIEALTGIDPVSAVYSTLESWGLPVSSIPGAEDAANRTPEVPATPE